MREINKVNKKPKTEYSTNESVRFLIRPLIEDIILRGKNSGNSFNEKIINYFNIPFNQKIKDIVLKRDEYKCCICNTKTNLHIHHIIPRQQGGNHDESNLITLCAKCHMHIETGDIEHAVTKCTKNYIANLEDNYSIKDETLSNREIIKSQNEFIKSIFDKLSKFKEKNNDITNILCSVDNYLGNTNFDSK